MSSVLDAIVEKIREDEGHLFRSFNPATFTLRPRQRPIDILQLMDSAFCTIAEVKRGSPSFGGVFRADFDPLAIASAYKKNGADAISVVTEKNFFYGSRKYLPLIKNNVKMPLLRKDFIFHPYQVYESYNLGADFILLIAACLSTPELKALSGLAESLGMRSLIEVHDHREIERTLELKPSLIGINNRNLHDLSVDWNRSLALRPLIPPGIKVISESGIHSARQIRLLKENGFAGVLVGEHLLKQDDPGRALREMIHG